MEGHNTGNITFRVWLRARRKALGLTQEELGRRLGYSADTIRKIELGTRRPSKQLTDLLADWLRVPSTKRTAFTLFARGSGGLPTCDERRDS